MLTAIPNERADWIAEHVLTGRYLTSCGGLDLVRMCACQYGRCGYCGLGQHRKCVTRVVWGGKPPARPSTYVVGRNGAALTAVWSSGTACRWTCSCTDCAIETPGERPATVVAYRKARGDLRPGDTVWLTPKTPGCPAVCWTQPRCTVVAVPRQGPYVVVKVGRTEHRVHSDNIRRSDPAASHGVVPVRPKPRPALPDGFQETPLF